MERNDSVQVEVRGNGCGIIVLWEGQAVQMAGGFRVSGPGGHHQDTDRQICSQEQTNSSTS